MKEGPGGKQKREKTRRQTGRSKRREEMTSKAKEPGGRNGQERKAQQGERKAQQGERMKGKVDKSRRQGGYKKDKEQDKGEMPE